MTAHSLRSQAYHWIGDDARGKADMASMSAIQASGPPTIGEDATARNEEGRRLLESGDPAAAEAKLTELILAEPDFVDAYRNRAYAHRQMGNESEAAADSAEAETLEQAAQALAAATDRSRSSQELRSPGAAVAGDGMPAAPTRPMLLWLPFAVFGLVFRAAEIPVTSVRRLLGSQPPQDD